MLTSHIRHPIAKGTGLKNIYTSNTSERLYYDINFILRWNTLLIQLERYSHSKHSGLHPTERKYKFCEKNCEILTYST
uniref:Uncharacterized protein n=1 Tax=Octopus bimaculoides TaxID=37653 RepID=A0A0L8IG98_OCTBM